MLKIVVALVLALSTQLLPAKEAPLAADNPELEKRVMSVSEELRCLVCQNQTIADSHADLAVDLRNEIREKIQQGASDQDIIDYMVARYGEFVLYRPPLKATTILLWFGPIALMLAGLAWLARRLRQRGAAPVPPLTDEERKRATLLLAEREGGTQ